MLNRNSEFTKVGNLNNIGFLTVNRVFLDGAYQIGQDNMYQNQDKNYKIILYPKATG